MKQVLTPDQLIRDYYGCFNERNILEAGAWFATAAVVDMPPFVQGTLGAEAHTQFAAAWLQAFPDAQLTIQHVEQRGDTMCEVDLLATGTHQGSLDLGGFGLLKPSGARLSLQLRELLEIRQGLITYASLSFDLNGLVRQLNRIDYDRLIQCLDILRHLADDLTAADPHSEQQREVTERIGAALDAARHAVRPQFKR